MKISQIVSRVATNAGIKPVDLMKTVDEVFSGITQAVERGEKVVIAGLGTFVQRTREAGERTNSKTGEKRVVEAGNFIAFKPAKAGAGEKTNKVKREKPEKVKGNEAAKAKP